MEPLAAGFRADTRLRTEVADLRHAFMTNGQALLHGDLHTGSVTAGRRDGTEIVRVLDPELSFVGPIGFDLGLYWANVLVSEARAHALGTEGDHAEQLRLSREGFEAEFRRLWPSRVDTFSDDDHLERFLGRVWTESVGFAGTEIIRRVIGFAHLADLTTLPDPLQVAASRRSLLLGRELVVHRAGLTDPESVRRRLSGLTGGRRRPRTCPAVPVRSRSQGMHRMAPMRPTEPPLKRPPHRRWRALLVLGLLAGLLGMHALAPGGVMGHHAAPERAVARTAVMVTAYDGCSGGDGHCGGDHAHHADATCASGALSGGPVLPAPVPDPVHVPVPDRTVSSRAATGPDAARAPPDLAELQLLRI